MKEHPYKKYIYAAVSLFGAVALSILFFFILFRIDAIGSMLKHIASTLMPFIVGALLAYIICPLCSLLEKMFLKLFGRIKNNGLSEKLARNFSVFSGIIITLIVVYLILIILIPQLIDSVVRIVQILPSSAERLVGWLQQILASNETLLQYSQQVIDKVYKFLENWLSNGFLESIENIATGLSSGVMGMLGVLMNIFIGLVVAVYILLARKKLARQSTMIVYSVFKKKTADVILGEVHYIDRVFSGFINGKILDAVIVSLICYFGMMIFKWVNPDSTTMSETLVAVIVGIFNIIPFFGWYIGLFLSALLILIVNPIQCIFFVIFDVILQQIDGNILGPKIIGNTTGISGFWVLFSIFLFGDLWGFAGMLFGVPLFAVIYHGLKKLVFRGLKRNGQEEMVRAYEKDYPDKEKEAGDAVSHMPKE